MVAPISIIIPVRNDAAALRPGRTKVVTRTITRTPAVTAPPEGRVRGVVRDANTKKVLAGAIIKYPTMGAGLTPQITAEDGTFLSYGLRPGPVWLEISRDDYEPQKVSTDVRERAESPIEVLLTPKPPETGRVTVKTKDETGSARGTPAPKDE